MTLARIIGLILVPIGVVVASWAFIGIMIEDPDNAGWVAPGLALGIGGAMIIVGVRYILKPGASKVVSGAEGDAGR